MTSKKIAGWTPGRSVPSGVPPLPSIRPQGRVAGWTPSKTQPNTPKQLVPKTGNPGINTNKRSSPPPLPGTRVSPAGSGVYGSGISISAFQTLKDLNQPQVVQTPLGAGIAPNPASIGGNAAFIAGVPGSTGTLKAGDTYTQYTVSDNPPRGTVLGTSRIPASLSGDGRSHTYNEVADGNGGSYSVEI